MTQLQERISQLTQAVENPRARLDYYLSQGKQVVGCLPVYTPEELVHAAGMIPMGLWGGQVELKQAKRFLPAFACSIMQSTLELGLRGSYQGLSAVIIPSLCDTFRCVTQDWQSGVKDIPMIAVTHPQNRNLAGSTDFLISEYESVLAKLSAVTGMRITDESLDNTIEIYNKHNQTMRTFAAVANEHLDVITPAVRHIVMKSAFFYEKSEHTALVQDVIDGLQALPVHSFTGKKVVLSGISAEPIQFMDILAENNIAVVGDDLAQESRQYRTDIPTKGGSPLRRLALQWNGRGGCSLIHEDFKQRGEMLVGMAKTTQADGAIYCLMKFCDPEEYDYPICARTLREAGVTTLLIEIDQQSTSHEQIRTRIQTFAEM